MERLYSQILLILMICMVTFSLMGQTNNPDVCWFLHTEDDLETEYRGIAPVDKDTCWIGANNKSVTDRLVFYLKDDRWIQDVSFPRKSIRGYMIDAVSPESFWITEFRAGQERVYDKLKITRYDGKTWHTMYAEPGMWPHDIDMIDENEGWICGNSGNFLHYKNGTWTLKVLQINDGKDIRFCNFMNMKMVNRKLGWAVGILGSVAKYEHDQWVKISVPDEFESIRFMSVDVTESGKIWIVGADGNIITYDGTEWVRMKSPVTTDLNSIDMISERDGWAVGVNGVILRYNGRIWEQQFCPVSKTLMKIKMITPTDGWIVGMGVILRSANFSKNYVRHVTNNTNRIMNFQRAHVISSADIDGDMDEDIFFLDDHRLFRNNGGNKFLDISDNSGITWNDDKKLIAHTWGDIDGDGDNDLLMFGSTPDLHKVFLNNGKGYFIDFTAGSDFQDGLIKFSSVHLVDVDRDNDQDLFLSRINTGNDTDSRNRIYINNGYGKFQPGQYYVPNKYNGHFTILHGDINLDHYPDVIFPLGHEESVWYKNTEEGLQSGQNAYRPFFEGQHGGSPWQTHLFDADNDGDQDVFMLPGEFVIYYNDGTGVFSESMVLPDITHNRIQSRSLSAVGDIDNDSFPDILLQNKSEDGFTMKLLMNRGERKYEDYAPYFGLHKITGENALLTDFDLDGDLDLYVSRGADGKNVFLENQLNNDSYFLVKIDAVRSDRNGRGALIKVYENGHIDDDAYLVASKEAGTSQNPRGFSASNLYHIGLPDSGLYGIVVTFPNGRESVVRNVTSGKIVVVTEYPFAIQHGLSILNVIKRGLFQNNTMIEVIKLAFVILILILIGLFIIKTFIWRLTLFVFPFVYLFLNGFFAASHRMSYHFFALFSFLILTAFIIFVYLLVLYVQSLRFLGHYKLFEKIGEGGMGKVYRARNIVTKKIVALKILNPEITQNENNKIRFIREGEMMKRLRHPNIVEIYETGEIDGKGFISMELLTGKTLGQTIKDEGSIDAKTMIPILEKVCQALLYIHEHEILHRDLKSENIFLVDNKKTSEKHDIVKLMDFGLSRSLAMNTITQTESLMGTIYYMSPEHIMGKKYEFSSDIYSLGVVLYEALTGVLPFNGDNEIQVIQAILNYDCPTPGELVSNLDMGIEYLTMKMMERNSIDRFSQIKDIIEFIRGPGLFTGIHSGDVPKTQTPEADGDSNIGAGENNRTFDEKKDKMYYFSRSQEFKSVGKDIQADAYMMKAFQSFVLEKSLIGDSVDKEIVISHTIRRLTRQWKEDYNKALSFSRDKKNHDARYWMTKCITGINEVLIMLPEEKHEVYIGENNIGEVLSFAESGIQIEG